MNVGESRDTSQRTLRTGDDQGIQAQPYISTMNSVVRIQAMDGYKLRLTFADGLDATVEVRSLIGKGFTQELLDEKSFQAVTTEPGGGIAWPNGFDLCPEFLRDLANKRQAAA